MLARQPLSHHQNYKVSTVENGSGSGQLEYCKRASGTRPDLDLPLHSRRLDNVGHIPENIIINMNSLNSLLKIKNRRGVCSRFKLNVLTSPLHASLQNLHLLRPVRITELQPD